MREVTKVENLEVCKDFTVPYGGTVELTAEQGKCPISRRRHRMLCEKYGVEAMAAIRGEYRLV